jgi:hypothetical protein
MPFSKVDFHMHARLQSKPIALGLGNDDLSLG